MVHIGTKEKRMAYFTSTQEREKAEDASREVGLKPHCIKITATMQGWERQLQRWIAEYAMLDAISEVDADMECEMTEVKHLDLERGHSPY